MSLGFQFKPRNISFYVYVDNQHSAVIVGIKVGEFWEFHLRLLDNFYICWD